MLKTQKNQILYPHFRKPHFLKFATLPRDRKWHISKLATLPRAPYQPHAKNNYSPNDRCLIKFFIKIISSDSSQRVPPMSSCPPLIITRVCPLLVNPHVPNVFFFGFAHSFPMSHIAFSQWNLIISKILWFRGRLFRGNTGKTLQGTYLPCGGERLINPMLALLHTYIIYKYITQYYTYLHIYTFEVEKNAVH